MGFLEVLVKASVEADWVGDVLGYKLMAVVGTVLGTAMCCDEALCYRGLAGRELTVVVQELTVVENDSDGWQEWIMVVQAVFVENDSDWRQELTVVVQAVLVENDSDQWIGCLLLHLWN